MLSLLIIIITLVDLNSNMSENIRVMVRVRPQLSFETEPIWLIKDNTLSTVTTLTHSSKRSSSSQRKSSRQTQKEMQYKFRFESVIEEGVTTEQIYKKQVKSSLIESYNSHRNLSIMAYGQTCSGKTHTILGVKQYPGIIPCVLRDIFSLKKQSERKCTFKLSYIEIYNQKIRDLLDVKQKPIKIVQSSKQGYQVSGVMKESISTFQDSLKLLERGEKNRQYGEGQYHQRSSRSHTLLSIFIDEWDYNLQVKSFDFTIVDLAGSERLVQPQQSSTQAGYINKSLFQLTNCISKLAQKATHIPFRDSKLTKLLESSLTGAGRSFVICCISPSKNCFSETLSTLRLAQRVKKIQLKEPIKNYCPNQTDTLRLKLQQKTRECSALKVQVQTLTAKINKLSSELQQKSSKESLKTNLLILFDHQNFTIFLQDHIDTFYTTTKDYSQIKQSFVSKMQQTYQQYTKKIVNSAFGDKFQLQIEELCFMNMVLEHQKIQQYKIDIISSLLKQQKGQPTNHSFYKALEQYRNKLQQSYGMDSARSYNSSNHTNNSLTLSFKESPNLVKSHLNKSQRQSLARYGNEVWIWGCKKDYRVCKGENVNVNIVRIKNLGKIRSVVCGYHHTLVVSEFGQLFGWGKNTQKQIINNSKECISSPILIEGVQGVQSAAAGWGHSLALTFEGQVFSWGYGKDGQLGNSSKLDCYVPKKILHEYQVVSIDAGHSHSAFLDVYGDMYTFGFNQDYRLMIRQKQAMEPKRITIRDVVDFSLGVTHTAVITSNGNVYAGGTARNGELGTYFDETIQGWEKMEVVDRKFQEENYQKICPSIQIKCFNHNNKAKSVKCGENLTFVLNQLGEVYQFGKSKSTAQRKINSSLIKNIDLMQCGVRSVFALNSKENKLYSWGFNMYGQANPEKKGDLDEPQLLQNLSSRSIINVSSGFFHTAVLFE